MTPKDLPQNVGWYFLSPGEQEGREQPPWGIKGLGEEASGKDFSIFFGFIHSD